MLNTKMCFPTSESLLYNTKVSCHMGMGKITDRIKQILFILFRSEHQEQLLLLSEKFTVWFSVSAAFSEFRLINLYRSSCRRRNHTACDLAAGISGRLGSKIIRM